MFHYCEPQKPPQVPLITIQMLSFDQNATFVYQILKLGFSTKIGITFIVMFERRYQYILNRKATLSQNSSHTWNISLSGKCCWYTSKVFTDFQSGWMTSSGAMARIYRPHLKCYFIAKILKANLWKVNELKENNQWRGFFDKLTFGILSSSVLCSTPQGYGVIAFWEKNENTLFPLQNLVVHPV